MNGGFVKGTMVHTREGLRPIEEIRAGDYVLSSPEDGTPKLGFKRVLKTLVQERSTIRQVIGDWGVVGRFEMIASAVHQPFWVEGIGWTRADFLNRECGLRLANGTGGSVVTQYPVYRTPVEGVGWTQEMKDVETSHGNRYDYLNAKGLPMGGFEDVLPSEILHGDDPLLKVPVFAIEVEDFHTYYVGKTGFWVHSESRTGSAAGGLGKSTLVHTREGLKAIEEIKVGDYVLSSPDDGSGGEDFKRVLRTLVHEERTIRALVVAGPDKSHEESLAAIGKQRFWVDGVGWSGTHDLYREDAMRGVKGTLYRVVHQHVVYRTEVAGVGWIQSSEELRRSRGNRYDYANARPVSADGEYVLPEEMFVDGSDPQLKVTVHAIEVEDYHTYYVGKSGVWIYN
jgi:hypothetical protein